MLPTPTIKSFLIADSVFQQISRKWCIVGVFERIYADSFPCLHYSLGIFLKIADAEGEYSVKVEVRDAEDHCLATIPAGSIRVTDRKSEVDFGIQTFGLLIPKAGVYFLKVFFNNEVAAGDIRFEVIERGSGDK